MLTRNVILKTIALFLLINFGFAWISPLPWLGKLSLYNHVLPGRQRLPYGDHPEQAYNISLFNLDAMFASHEISDSYKPANEFRVVLIGDSSTWGFLLPPFDTLSANLNKANITLANGQKLHFYNLGYPVMSLTKDLLILEKSQRYKPDLVIWLVTLESFPYDKQLFPPLLQHNPLEVIKMIKKYQLSLNPDDPQLIKKSFWDQTLVGSRRELADLLRLQLYAPMWAATGIDQEIPETYAPRQEDLSSEIDFHGFLPSEMNESDLATGNIQAGIQLIWPAPVLVVNEPIFISEGKNSELRYNFFYPRWAFDEYREILREISSQNHWLYFDFWDQIPPEEFTNTAIHLSPTGSQILADKLLPEIIRQAEKTIVERHTGP